MTSKKKCEAYDKVIKFLKLYYEDFCKERLETWDKDTIVIVMMEMVYRNLEVEK